MFASMALMNCMRLGLVALFGLAGCASAPAPPTASAQSGPDTCTLVRVEQSRVESDGPHDALLLKAVYTPGHRSAPVEVEVEVRRERANDLRAQLEAEPELMCEPDPAARGGYAVQLPF